MFIGRRPGTDKKKNIKKESLSPGVGWGSIFWSMLRHSALVFLRSSGIWWMFSPACLGWIWTGVFCIPDSRNPKTNLDPEWAFRWRKWTAEKTTSKKQIRDLNGFRDPSFPLHLVKAKMCHLDVFGLNLGWWPHFVSPYAPPGQALFRQPAVTPGCDEPTTETNMEPNEFNFWGDHLQQIHHKIVTFVFLLLLVALSISFLVCWYLLSFQVACFFSLRCQVFCLLRLTLEGCATNTEPNTYPKIGHDLFLEVFWFQFFPHHRPGTSIVIQTWSQYEVKSRVARKSLTWNFQGKRVPG